MSCSVFGERYEEIRIDPLRERVIVRIVFARQADMAQLVEHHLAKVGVAGSNPVVRSIETKPVIAWYFGRLIS